MSIITPEFVSQYVDKTPPWGFNGMGEIVYRRTYSRDIEALGRKEYWFETIARAINGAQEIGAEYTKEEAERLFDYIFNLKGIFAGRALWQLGTPLVRKMSGVSLVNCLGGETMVPTKYGAKRIDDLAKIGHAVIMTDHGRWVDAPIQCFGEQPLATITLKRGKQRKSVRATANHIWLKHTDRRVEVTTDQLQPGDKLASVKGQGVSSMDMSRDGIRHGLVFGDGSVYPQGSRAFVAHKDLLELETYFIDYKSTETDHGKVFRNLPRSYKSAPDLNESRGYLYGWLAGYFAADGYSRSGKGALISSTNRDNLQLVKDVCVLIGVPTGPITEQTRVSNLTDKESVIYNVNLTINDPEFFLLSKHRGEFDGENNFDLRWTVESVSDYGDPEPVYCAVVPETHTFALEDNLLTHNCWMTTISKVEDFQFLMDHLMVGGGVGFTVERAVVHDLPKVKGVGVIAHEKTNDADFIVPDSRQGWSALLGKVLNSYFHTGESFTYSTILIRGFGAPLKTFGGTASGPEVLIEGIADICKILDARIGKKIRSVDALDICNIIGKIVVAGSARRSAQIAIGDPDDFLYLRAKNWAKGDIPAWRANSNNSIFADSYDEIIEEFWKGYDGTGEPYGLINRDLIRKTGRLGEKINDSKVIGTNPCVTGDTWVLTDLGPRVVTDLLDQSFVAIVDGKPYDATAFWKTGTKQVLRIVTSNGYTVRVTDNHKIMTPDRGWIEAGLLESGDKVVLHDHTGASWSGSGTEDEGYVLGSLVGDGTFYPNGTPAVAVWSSDPGSDRPKEELGRIMNNLPHRSDFNGWYQVSTSDQFRSSHVGLRELAKQYSIVKGNKTITPEVEMASSAFYVGFLRGLFDADGCVEGVSTKGGVSIRLSQSNFEMIYAAQRMLARLGIISSVYSGHDAGYKDLPGGRYYTKESYRLSISGYNAQKFIDTIGFYNQNKMQKWIDKTADMSRGFYSKDSLTTVVDIIDDGFEDVYDCTVSDIHAFDANGIYVHNCGEIGLEDGEPCNLAEIFLPNIESKEELLDLSRLLYKTQKAITTLDYPYAKSQSVITRNRRLGQGITGWLQATEEQLSWIDDCYKSLREYDKQWSKEMGVNASIKLTTVKPSGTLSLLAGVTPGIHPAYSQYYIRRVRMGSSDPLVNYCRDKGYDVQYDVGLDGKENHTVCVVSFPCETPEHATLAKDLTAVQQLEWVVNAQSVWADNNVSVTVYYRKEELPEIQEWMKNNYKDKLKSVSFLLHSDHGFALAPYEEIDKATYDRLKSRIKEVSFVDQLNEYSLSDLECEGGACPIR